MSLVVFQNILIFRIRKMTEKRQIMKMNRPMTEREILAWLENGVRLPPLRLTATGSEPRLDRGSADALVQAEWDGRIIEFVAEIKARSTPMMLEAAMRQAREYAERSGRYPLVVLPHLRTDQLEKLENARISGIDLSGNGIIIIPGQLLVYRTGAPRRYREPVVTRHAYRGVTSLVPRVFLCRRQFKSLRDIEQEIAVRGGAVTLATISKALKRLQEDLLIERGPSGIRLLQADGLLEKLAASYTPPKVRRRIQVKLVKPLEDLLSATSAGLGVVLSGASSAKWYAVMGRADRPVLYSRDAQRVLSTWGDNARLTERFAEVELCETEDPTVYFDMRIENGIPIASPVQTYLELASGDKRDQETAEQIQERILRDLEH